jgi:hypothetical protein
MTITVNESYITWEANRSHKTRAETRHLVLHETVSKATARQQLAYFNGGGRDANAHGFIDWNEILVTLPLDEVGWHVGQPANQFTEGYELCRASNAQDFARQWEAAVAWFAYRCQVHGHGADMIRSHHEIAKQYGGTDHTDPDEYFAMFGRTVDDFRADVAGKLANDAATKQPAPTLDPLAAKEAIEELQRLAKAAHGPAVVGYNLAENSARRAAGLPIEQELGTPSRDVAEEIVAILHELWHLTDRAALQAAYAHMADELRKLYN